jgi:hypothetical protein
VSGLYGYDYDIIYKNGKENVVAHALSRKYEEEEGSLFSLIHFHQLASCFSLGMVA